MLNISNNFGFIITRHVNSKLSNEFWLECVKQIKTFYPYNKIIIIDDNSDYSFVDSKNMNLDNCLVIQSNYKGRAELLPYYYFYNYHFFDKVVIIHDNVFILKNINFQNIDEIKYLWEFEHNWDNEKEEIKLIKMLNNNEPIIDFYYKKHLWKGIFGVMCVIDYSFLKKIVDKYNIFTWIDCIKQRNDRYQLERVMAVLFNFENRKLIENSSLFGNIHHFISGWGYKYENYVVDKNNGGLEKLDIIKIWAER